MSQRELLKILKENPMQIYTSTELSIMMGISRASISNNTKRLNQLGFIKIVYISNESNRIIPYYKIA